MMFKKGLGCELSGFQVPNVPRAPRSIRRTTLHRQTVEDGEACAFEVLASLAGKLLQEGESSDSSNASEALGQPATGKDVFKPEGQFDEKPMKTECVDQGSSETSIVGFDSATESSIDPKVSPHDKYNAFNEQTSANKNFSHLDNLSSGLKSCKGKAVFDKCLPKLEGGSCNVKTEDRSEMDQDTEGFGLAVLTMRSNDCFSKDTSRDSGVAPAPFNLGRDYKLQLCRDHFRNASFPRHRKDSKLGIRDDDEKFSRSSRLSNRYKASRPPQRIGERRIRKLLASKCWKAAPKLKDYEVTGADGQTMPLYQKRKSCFSHETSQYAAVHKKRKFYNQGSVLSSEGGLSSESVSNSPEKDVSRSVPSLLMEEDVVLTGDQAPQTAKDSHVKLSIKSFRIPELFIEVPETATVGSLKRTVMEAVTALLGGGVCVGLLLEGKKVRDDGRTLNQTGISCKDDLNTVGFTLEPNPAQAPPPLRAEDHPLPLSCDATHDPTRSETSPVDSEIPDVLTDPLELNNTVKHMDSNHDVVPSSTDLLTDQSESGSKALVPVPPMNVGALSVVPLSQQKPKKSELAPRRTRRPFSVSEVEALVQAVEELGTGRWRDVKLQAFEDAEHRTYVDLKDKWKTLVHTARISPQQRRGEPVPQELLNRVLAAHAYWSEHQTKQQSKHLSGRTVLEICN